VVVNRLICAVVGAALAMSAEEASTWVGAYFTGDIPPVSAAVWALYGCPSPTELPNLPGDDKGCWPLPSNRSSPLLAPAYQELACSAGCGRVPRWENLLKNQRFQPCSLCRDPRFRFCCKEPCFATFYTCGLGGGRPHRDECPGRREQQQQRRRREAKEQEGAAGAGAGDGAGSVDAAAGQQEAASS
jgi:hypothetical protein